jgi:hypothetical protein
LKTVAEGLIRIHRDKAEFERINREAKEAPLPEGERASLGQDVTRQIEKGYLPKRAKNRMLRKLVAKRLFDREFQRREEASQKTKREVRVPGEPEVIAKLLRATKPEQIVKLCHDAFVTRRVEVKPGVFKEVQVPNWPISGNSMLPMYLSQYAAEFIAAKKDPRFPRSSRPTNLLKQLWFLSRALAGALHGVSTRTAINLVGSVRPDEMVEESHAKRKREKPKR